MTKLQTSSHTCEYILENRIHFNNTHTLIQMKDELVTRIILVSLYNPWTNDNHHLLEICHTKLIPYREMFFTDDINNIRNIIIEIGQTIQIQCNDL